MQVGITRTMRSEYRTPVISIVAIMSTLSFILAEWCRSVQALCSSVWCLRFMQRERGAARGQRRRTAPRAAVARWPKMEPI
ncbi:MAG: hypothetical protein K0R41_668 [Geminicoccaceae bacterium]|nr:hypothetical protein [Geminicoccaceae bacterium]